MGCLVVLGFIALVIIAQAFLSRGGSKPVTEASAPAAQAAAPVDLDVQMEACAKADDQTSRDWLVVIKKRKNLGTFQTGPFHDHLVATVATCAPVLDSLGPAADPVQAAVLRMCHDGLALRLGAYQDMLDGRADTDTARKLILGADEMAHCNRDLAQMAKP